MFEDPELPDFDSMSQEELIEWLEALAKMQGAAASEFIDDGVDGNGERPPQDAPDETWSAWLDDANERSAAQTPPAENGDAAVSDNFEAADEETPLDLARYDADAGGPLDAEAMAWLAEISAAETEEELPEITDYRAPAPPSAPLDELLEQGAEDDPLEWLDALGRGPAGPRLPAPADDESEVAAREASADPGYGDDFDDAYEDDETLDDLEDESLYSRRRDTAASVLESILGMQDRDSDEFSTQSMAPVPEHVAPRAAEAGAVDADAVSPARSIGAGDSLTQAFMLQDQPVDLEAWYSSRLAAIAAAEDGAAQTAIPDLEQATAPENPPPPGLAAAIYSARGKVGANAWREALADYETLLRTSAGLEWVVADMRGLIAREQFRHNPSVHRVLGDALMRQGQLDAAIDVYRHALSLL